MNLKSTFHVVIPASGIGSRFGGNIPKQYSLMANGQTILDTTIQRFIEHNHFETITIALNEQDNFFQHSLFYNHPKITTVIGGEQRFLSVKNALDDLAQRVNEDDFICIHDSVRPCVSDVDINNLLTTIDNDEVGGLLVSSVVDTLKIGAGKHVVSTVDREKMYHALTPQAYRLGILRLALTHVIENNIAITDDASSIEELGKKSIAVVGDSTNIKITTQKDLALANLLQTL